MQVSKRLSLDSATCSLLFVLAAPLVLVLTLPNPINQLSMIDPYVYTGYTHGYTQLLERFGATYYGNRFSFIEIGRIFSELFGQHGYLSSKLLYLGTITGCAYLIFCRFYSREVAIFIALWVCFNPWLIRSVFYDYVEGGAIAFVFITLAILLRPPPHTTIHFVTAGFAAAIAVNMHYFTGLIGLAFAPAWLVINRDRSFFAIARQASLFTVGFVMSYTLILVLQNTQYPALGFLRELTSLRVGAALISGGGSQWFKSLSQYIIDGNYYVLLPIPIMVVAATKLLDQRRGTSDRAHAAASLFLAAMIAIYLFLHFALSLGAITHFFSFIYLFPALVLAFGTSIGRISESLSSGQRYRIFSAGLLLLLSLWFSFPKISSTIETIPLAAYVAVALLFMLLSMASGARKWALIACMLFASTAHAVFYHPIFDKGISRFPESKIKITAPRSYYSSIHDEAWGKLEADTYYGAIELLEFIGSNAPPSRGRVGFWYSNNDTRSVLSSMQSIFLWGYTRIQNFAPAPGLPVIDETTKSNILAYRFIALLGLSQGEIDTGLQALQSASIPYNVVQQRLMVGRAIDFYVTLVERLPVDERSTTPFSNFDPKTFRLSGGDLRSLDGYVRVTTPNVQWAYGSIGDISALGLPAGPTSIRLRVDIRSGLAGIAITDKQNSNLLLDELEVGPMSAPFDVYIKLQDGSRAGSLIIRNRSGIGPTVVDVYDKDVSAGR